MSVRMCRECGCTDDRACVDEETGVRCHWIGPDLCSFCAADRIEAGI